MRDKRTKQRAITKAITVFIGGLLFAAYLEWQHSMTVATIGFILFGALLSYLVYKTNRPN
ncbi:hypothetical protein [Corynebacterium stationis]|uniref:hypothetical protein n=1 Tax=Corynebacterium stationis TaxID=1705 RepID=UPI002609E6C2|nr:hypothetical protein [Corynebacterium stationis]